MIVRSAADMGRRSLWQLRMTHFDAYTFNEAMDSGESDF